jgi:DNA-binding HxlR family transcriptional regulator
MRGPNRNNSSDIEVIPSVAEVLEPGGGSGGRRRYGQLCSIALALEVVGDRWAILLLRELLAGGKRFTDLAAGLPGVGTAVLTERLRELEQHGLVRRRRLGPPAPALVYELTPRGTAMEPVLVGLARWGAAYLAGGEDLASRGRWLLQAMAATAGKSPAGIQTTNFMLDGEECHVEVSQGRWAVRDGLQPGARLTVRGTVRDLYLLATAPPKAAAPSEPFEVVGDRGSVDRLLRHLILGVQQAAAAGTPP